MALYTGFVDTSGDVRTDYVDTFKESKKQKYFFEKKYIKYFVVNIFLYIFAL